MDNNVVFKSMRKDNTLTVKLLWLAVGIIIGVFVALAYQIIPFWAFMSLFVLVSIAILTITLDIILERERSKHRKFRLSN